MHDGPVMNWTLWMAPCLHFLAAAFFVATALWMGTLFSASWLSGRARMMADSSEIGRLSLSLFRRWATPSLLASLAAGFGWLMVAPGDRTRAYWVYSVVAAFVLLVTLHLAVGSRADRIARGSISATRGEGVRRFALLLSFGAIVAIASLRASLMP